MLQKFALKILRAFEMYFVNFAQIFTALDHLTAVLSIAQGAESVFLL